MMRSIVLTFVFLMPVFLTACVAGPAAESRRPQQEPASAPAPAETATKQPPAPAIQFSDSGPAPEIANETWINAAAPLTLADLRGKVVLLEFWTFGCINCQRVIPFVRQWHSDYQGTDFQVISIHYPEFARERDYDNVVEATQRFEIVYPVALDNDGRTWRAYQQRYWPTTYLIDRNGHIRYKHIGEFNEETAARTEAAIEALLAESSPN